jgi:spermidine synthase/MFS family permease
MKIIAQAVFFTSGFAALLYQITWQRLLTFFSGVDVYSVTIIVAAFMAGLGLGSVAGGYFADRLRPVGRLLSFALSELAISLFAVASTGLFYDALYVTLGPLGPSRITLATILFAALLWPTFFMGMSLPLLARALSTDDQAPARWVNGLYGWNTLGAACGSLVAVWVVFRTTDFRTATWIGAFLSFCCAVAAVGFARHAAALPQRATPPPTTDSTSQNEQKRPAGFPLSVWIAVYCLSGFIALSLEIVWFRMLGVVIKSNSLTFGNVLTVYLAGVGLGALIVDRTRLNRLSPVPAFFALQSSIPLYVIVSLVLLVGSVGYGRPLAQLWAYMAGYEPLSLAQALGPVGRGLSGFGAEASREYDFGLFVILYGLIPIALIGPPTLMMGMSFAYLQRAVQTDLAALGRRVGWLQAANIMGSMLGALFTGLIALHWLGTVGTLRLLMGLGAVFLVPALGTVPGLRRHPVMRLTAAGAVVGIALWMVPEGSEFWARLHGVPSQAPRLSTVIIGEDRTGLSVIKVRADGRQAVVHANGIGQSELPYGGIHTELGALPVLVHPRPARVAVIGLGSGDTLFSIGGRPETTVIDSIEIVEPALETLRRLNGYRPYPGLVALLQDPRVQHYFTDGRAFLMRQPAQYDVIEADALRPNSSLAGHLYSVEYFELLRDRLRPGGFAVTWSPTPRVLATLLKVFPHALESGGIAIGSSTPIAFDVEAIRQRIQSPFTRDYYLAGGIDIEKLLARHLHSKRLFYRPEMNRSALTDVNTDLFPKDEFMLPSTESGEIEAFRLP